VTILGPDDDAGTLAIDALIEPSIDAFEFSVPSQSKTESYAVWIRYRLKVYDNAGDMYANWPLSAYGKSEQFGLTGDEPLKRAAILAMRDAAALMIMNLDKSTAISALKDRPAIAVASAKPAAEEPAPAEKRTQLPKRRQVDLPPPGPAAGPAVLSMDADSDTTRERVPEGSSNE
jgi:hypothetical protein